MVREDNKAVYAAALVADGWAGAENLEKYVLHFLLRLIFSSNQQSKTKLRI